MSFEPEWTWAGLILLSDWTHYNTNNNNTNLEGEMPFQLYLGSGLQNGFDVTLSH